MVMGEHRPKTPHGSRRNHNPNCGISLSKKVRIKSSRQAKLSSLDLARNERGKPPRHQSRSHVFVPVSLRSKGTSWTNSTRPARVSDTDLIIPGDALPRMRKRAGFLDDRREPAEHEEMGHHLNFIQDHRPFEGSEHQLGVLAAA